MPATTFYWHDYETWGADPSRDRPSQFAGLRTDAELNEIGEPLVTYCQPALDVLPHPEACLVTGITPQKALAEGLPEYRFIAAIHAELARPGTCGVGYNSIRFDDEVTRFTLYRNFYDPYAREWQNGNSRWDLIDVVRACRALRPEGIEWPDHPDGTPSFRLEDLTRANGIPHEGAHDALSDVRATLGLARLLRRAQPKLFDYLLGLRNKRRVAELIDWVQHKPLLHTSGMIPAMRGCTTLVMPLAPHPVNSNGVICFDLSVDPSPLLELDAEALRARVFSTQAELEEQGAERVPLKVVHLNRCPVLATVRLLDDAVAERLQLDPALCERHYQQLMAADGLVDKVRNVFRETGTATQRDADGALYTGGFLSDADRRLAESLRDAPPEQLDAQHFPFADARLNTLLARYRARHFPGSLDAAARAAWLEDCRRRLTDPAADGSLQIDVCRARIQALLAERDTARDQAILHALAGWVDDLEHQLAEGVPG